MILRINKRVEVELVLYVCVLIILASVGRKSITACKILTCSFRLIYPCFMTIYFVLLKVMVIGCWAVKKA